MKQFTDKTGKVWTIDINIGTVEDVKSTLGVDLLRIEDGEPTLLDRLADDLTLLAEIVCVLLGEHATAAELKRSFDGKTIAACRKAFYEELIDFFLQCGRKDRATAMQKHAAAMELGIEEATARIDRIDIDKMIRGKSFTNSPE